jgi:hypothetical protein
MPFEQFHFKVSLVREPLAFSLPRPVWPDHLCLEVSKELGHVFVQFHRGKMLSNAAPAAHPKLWPP